MVWWRKISFLLGLQIYCTVPLRSTTHDHSNMYKGDKYSGACTVQAHPEITLSRSTIIGEELNGKASMVRTAEACVPAIHAVFFRQQHRRGISRCKLKMCQSAGLCNTRRILICITSWQASKPEDTPRRESKAGADTSDQSGR